MLIRSALLADVPQLQKIEKAAAQIFRSVHMDDIAEGDGLSEDTLCGAIKDLRVFVAEFLQMKAIGFLVFEPMDGQLFIREVSVVPECRGHRVGHALIQKCLEHAQQKGMGWLFLTTFRDVPWNAPYYQRIGFEEVPSDDIGPQLLERLRHEEKAFINSRMPAVRIAMRQRIMP